MYTYAPTNIPLAGAHPENMVNGYHPTIAQVNRYYGSNSAQKWMYSQIVEFATFCSVLSKYKPYTIMNLCNNIVAKFHYLKVSELMLFIYNLEIGKYNDGWRVVTPDRFVRALTMFIGTDRAQYITNNLYK